jgi:iron-sulfur cluster repair protein YtfE (RIC family)
MMHFLHLHHTGEDVGLWPLVRARNPSAATLLDQMEQDHRRIGPAVTALEEAARAYEHDAAARAALLDALTGLSDVLLAHLRREELEMMPVVAATLTDAEYRAVEHEHFVAPKGLRELGLEAHWVLDGLPAEGREVMLSVVPAVPRFVLLHGFARGYRRSAVRRWGTGPAARVPSLQLATATQAS